MVLLLQFRIQLHEAEHPEPPSSLAVVVAMAGIETGRPYSL